MNYNSLDIIVDSQGLPVSQYYSEENQEFAVETTDGSVVLRSDIDFRLKTLILDRDGFPLPQLWDPTAQEFVPRTKSNNGGSGGTGADGKSAFEIAVENGFVGNEKQWLESLKGQDGLGGVVNYPVVTGEIGVVDTSYPVGNVRRYGAVGNYVFGSEDTSGFVDDSLAFQNAFDTCFALQVECVVPDGKYIIVNTLKLPSKLTIKGSNSKNIPGDTTNSNCLMLFINMVGITGKLIGQDSAVQLNCSGIHFISGNYSTESFLFRDLKLYSSNIENNNFHGFGTILQGTIHALSQVKANHFNAILKSFLLQSRYNEEEPSLVDSYIKDNYISGAKEFNPVFFDVLALAHSYIQDNFFDFAKIIFKIGYGCGGTNFSGNIFDMSFRVFTGNFGKARIVNNQFTHISDRYSWFVNPDQQMREEEWMCFEMESKPFNDLGELVISENYCYMTDNFVIFVDPEVTTTRFRSIRITNNIYDEEIVNKVSFQSGAQGAPCLDIYIDDLMDLEVSTLPNPAVIEVPIATSFNGQTLIYQNKKIFNNKGVWNDYMGNVVT